MRRFFGHRVLDRSGGQLHCNKPLHVPAQRPALGDQQAPRARTVRGVHDEPMATKVAERDGCGVEAVGRSAGRMRGARHRVSLRQEPVERERAANGPRVARAAWQPRLRGGEMGQLLFGERLRCAHQSYEDKSRGLALVHRARSLPGANHRDRGPY
jgi:hypothetical protein